MDSIKQALGANDWNTYTLVVQSDRGPLTIKWSDPSDLAKYLAIQDGGYIQVKHTLQNFYECFPGWEQYNWDSRFDQGIYNLPDNAVIIDIGAGMSVTDLLISQYLPNSKFYLVDKEEVVVGKNIWYDSDYPFYNSWSPLLDGIRTTDIDPSRFTLLSPESNFPKQVDCITSYLSYCWHYPKEVYWDRVMESLKIGGKLVLDVRHLIDRDVVDEISQDLHSTPTVQYFPNLMPLSIDDYPTPDPNKPCGGRYMWVRNG